MNWLCKNIYMLHTGAKYIKSVCDQWHTNSITIASVGHTLYKKQNTPILRV